MKTLLTIAESLRRMPRPQRIETLRSMASTEKPKSIARRQIEAALQSEMLKQIRQECRRRRRDRC